MRKPTDLVEMETMLLARHIHLRSRSSGIQLDRSAYVLLSRIHLEGPMSIGQLSEAFSLDASTLNRQTAAMMREGLIERIPDPDGGIARKFQVTAEGARKMEADRAFGVAGLDRVLENWTAEEVADFVEMLKRFNTDIERLDGRPWPRPATDS